jgi:hypothetical protein
MRTASRINGVESSSSSYTTQLGGPGHDVGVPATHKHPNPHTNPRTLASRHTRLRDHGEGGERYLARIRIHDPEVMFSLRPLHDDLPSMRS